MKIRWILQQRTLRFAKVSKMSIFCSSLDQMCVNYKMSNSLNTIVNNLHIMIIVRIQRNEWSIIICIWFSHKGHLPTFSPIEMELILLSMDANQMKSWCWSSYLLLTDKFQPRNAIIKGFGMKITTKLVFKREVAIALLHLCRFLLRHILLISFT